MPVGYRCTSCTCTTTCSSLLTSHHSADQTCSLRFSRYQGFWSTLTLYYDTWICQKGEHTLRNNGHGFLVTRPKPSINTSYTRLLLPSRLTSYSGRLITLQGSFLVPSHSIFSVCIRTHASRVRECDGQYPEMGGNYWHTLKPHPLNRVGVVRGVREYGRFEKGATATGMVRAQQNPVSYNACISLFLVRVGTYQLTV